jgi:hypothetical protein
MGDTVKKMVEGEELAGNPNETRTEEKTLAEIDMGTSLTVGMKPAPIQPMKTADFKAFLEAARTFSRNTGIELILPEAFRELENRMGAVS